VKLVRDLIPQIIEQSGKNCTYHEADYVEFEARLYSKMTEELNEFIEEPSVEEAADMYEVLCSICWLHKISLEDVTAAAQKKKMQRGGFYKGLVLEKVIDEKE
jgi:predicted house-cleaning noncanonical NTP pyrophosphatase (MazG superfamily)